MSFSPTSISSAYEDSLHRVDWQTDASKAYPLASYHGAERQHVDASKLYQDWWPYPGPAFSSMDLSQASDVFDPLLPRTLAAHHECSFGENEVPTVSFHHGTLPHMVNNLYRPCAHPTFNHWQQLQQFPACAVAAPAGGAMSTQADVSDGLNAAMGASGIAVPLQSETHAWHTSLEALSPGALPQCNVQIFDDKRTAKRRKKENNAISLVCPECPGKSKSTRLLPSVSILHRQPVLISLSL